MVAKGKLIILIVVAMGTFYLGFLNREETQGVKSVEEYWQETGLKLVELEELLQPELCSSSERYFLSCANAVVTIAQRFGLQVQPSGKIIESSPNSSQQDESEKIQLASWKKFYQEKHPDQSHLAVPFIQMTRDLLARNKKRSQDAFYVGMGFNGFLSIFKDPHTYITPMKYYQEVTSQPDTKTFSLGITLGHDQEGFVLRKVQPRSVAEDVGLKRGDKILRINSKNVESLSIGQVLELLRSEPTQSIEITVRRNNQKISFKLKRKLNSNQAIVAKILPGSQKLGLLTINRFSYEACAISKKLVEHLSEKGIRGLLVDLRDNPGGLVEEAACMASLFIGPQKMFVLKYLDPTKEEEVFYGDEAKIFNKPVAVLINSETASSAELFAGILRDYNRAVVVGERSFGKGSFQEGTTWFKNPHLALFQTQGLFYLPSGASPQVTGIEPDVEVRGKSSLQEREAQIFLYPLQASGKIATPMRKKLNLKECMDKSSRVRQEDPELSQAQMALSCQSLGASQRKTSDFEGTHDSDRSF